MNHTEIVKNMVAFAIKSTKDLLEDADSQDIHGDLETLLKALQDTQAKLNAGEPSNASHAFFEETYNLWYEKLSPLIGVDINVLHFRLFDLEGHLNNKDLARWDWRPTQYIQ